MGSSAFNLSETHVHLGPGGTAVPVPDFQWTDEFLQRYVAEHHRDGGDGRLVMVTPSDKSWTFWERHPAGDEVVFLISGRMTLVQQVDGTELRIDLAPGDAAINPRGTWHSTDVHQPANVLFVTPGFGTEHRPR